VIIFDISVKKLAIFVLAVGLTACGGSSDGGDDSTTAPPAIDTDTLNDDQNDPSDDTSDVNPPLPSDPVDSNDSPDPSVGDDVADQGSEPVVVPDSTDIVVNNPEELNDPPDIVSFSADLITVMVNDPVVFSWDIVDANSDVLTCRLDADGDGVVDVTFTSCSSSTTATHFYGVPGDYSALLTVTDVNGAVVTSELNDINVLPVMARLTTTESAVAGGRVLYNLRISNVSLVPITNTQVTLRLPSGISFSAADDSLPNTAGCGFICLEGEEAVWAFDTLQPGESRTIEVNALLDEDLFDEVISASFTIIADDLLTSIDVAQEIRVNNVPASSLALEIDALAVVPGDEFNIEVHIGNIASNNLDNVDLRLSLPPGVEFVAASDDGVQTDASSDIVWTIPNLPVLQTLRRSITVVVESSAVPGLILPFVASVDSTGSPASNVIAGLSVPVVSQPLPLLFDIATISNPIQQNSRLFTNITVSNPSLTPVRDIQLIIRVPFGLSFSATQDASPDVDNCGFVCNPAEEAVWVIQNLNAGESTSFSVNADTDEIIPGGSLISIPFTIISSDIDQNLQSRFTTRVDNNPRIQFVSSITNNPVSDGDEFEINLDIGNISNQNLQNGTLTLTVPENVSLISTGSSNGQQVVDNGLIVWSGVTADVLSVVRNSARFAVNSDVTAGLLNSFEAELDFNDSVQIDVESDSALAFSQQSSPLSIEIGTIESSAQPGGRLQYQIVLSNSGLIPLNNITLVYRVPEAISFSASVDAMPNPTECGFECNAGEEAFWFFETLQPGERQEIDINANVSELLSAGSIVLVPIRVIAEDLPFIITRKISTPAQ